VALLCLFTCPATGIVIDEFTTGPIFVELGSGGGLEYEMNQVGVATPTGQRRIVASSVPLQVADPFSLGLQIAGMADITVTNTAGNVAFQYEGFSEFNLADISTNAFDNSGFVLQIDAKGPPGGAIGEAVVTLKSGEIISAVTQPLFADAISNLFFPFTSFEILPAIISNFNGSIELQLRSERDSSYRITGFSTAPFPIPEPTSVFICSMLAILAGAVWRMRSVFSR
jgi:hypothetical protein